MHFSTASSIPGPIISTGEPTTITKCPEIDPASCLPKELLFQIFSDLTLHELGSCCLMSRAWLAVAENSQLWKMLIFKELAHTTDKWAKIFGEEVVKDEDRSLEFDSFPDNIVDDYRKIQKAFPEKKAKKFLVLARVPKTLNGGISLDKLGKLVKPYFPNAQDEGYAFVQPGFKGDWTIKESVWVLMTAENLPGSAMENFEQQTQMVSNLSKNGLPGFEIAKAIPAVTCIFAKCFFSEENIFAENLTRCQDVIHKGQTFGGLKTEDIHLAIGRFGPEGLNINDDFLDGEDLIGVAICKTFDRNLAP